MALEFAKIMSKNSSHYYRYDCGTCQLIELANYMFGNQVISFSSKFLKSNDWWKLRLKMETITPLEFKAKFDNCIKDSKNLI
jgi:endogenous inhibitor of DNA gyrase (YacG/DUF329 family)